MFVRINGETYYLWRAVDHEGEVLEAYATKRRDRKAALCFFEALDEALRPSRLDRHRPVAFIQSGDGDNRQRRQPGRRKVAEQQG